MDVVLPKWGMTMQEAVIGDWAVAVGDEVSEGQVLVSVESDKVDADVESPGSGTVAEILAQTGDTVEVGSVIARLT